MSKLKCSKKQQKFITSICYTIRQLEATGYNYFTKIREELEMPKSKAFYWLREAEKESYIEWTGCKYPKYYKLTNKGSTFLMLHEKDVKKFLTRLHKVEYKAQIYDWGLLPFENIRRLKNGRKDPITIKHGVQLKPINKDWHPALTLFVEKYIKNCDLTLMFIKGKRRDTLRMFFSNLYHESAQAVEDIVKTYADSITAFFMEIFHMKLGIPIRCRKFHYGVYTPIPVPKNIQISTEAFEVDTSPTYDKRPQEIDFFNATDAEIFRAYVINALTGFRDLRQNINQLMEVNQKLTNQIQLHLEATEKWKEAAERIVMLLEKINNRFDK